MRQPPAELSGRQSDQREGFGRRGLGSRVPDQSWHQGGVAQHRPVRQQTAGLRHEPKAAAQGIAGCAPHVDAIHTYHAGRGLHQTIEAAQERGLPRSTLAHDRQQGTSVHLERHATQRGGAAICMMQGFGLERDGHSGTVLVTKW